MPSGVVRTASTLFFQHASQYQQSLFDSSTVALGNGSPFLGGFSSTEFVRRLREGR
ncbi:hypothetical protein AB0P17_14080 [Streptomyces sp. NPDC088124]|uniref:hypothetical protein n=1 Tax=Streptomyces sp. NPDC088124 TaxID=3154654 RepID=UPI00341DAC2A